MPPSGIWYALNAFHHIVKEHFHQYFLFYLLQLSYYINENGSVKFPLWKLRNSSMFHMQNLAASKFAPKTAAETSCIIEERLESGTGHGNSISGVDQWRTFLFLHF